MKFGLIVILSLVLGALAANFLLANPGLVLINFMGYTIQMSMPILIFLMLLAYILVRLFVRIWQAPAQLGEMTAKSRMKRANKRITRGYIELAEGNFAKGEKLLTKGIRSSETPLLNYLAAARAAQAQGDSQRRDNWLQMAYEQDPDAGSAVLLTQAELQLQNNEAPAARSTLGRIIKRSPRSSEAIRLLAEVCLQEADWQTLAGLLPKLRKRLSKDQFSSWSIACYKGLLEQAGNSKLAMDAAWKQVPRNLRQEQDLVVARIEAATRAGEHSEAEVLLRKALERQWDTGLVRRYGLLLTAEPQNLLKHAEKWLKEHPADPELLLTTGRLCIRTQLWGKARSYLESSIAMRPSAETYNELGQLMLKLDEPEKASDAFRQGLELNWLNNTRPLLKAAAEPAAGQ
ncbi:MAG: heme biosynthesis HemY N-terminal domain-containing protein [Gammaproteobacteria bacterium]|nr:heme biosynthesis HemY N-terminal domain-containing protein [Gammaproteobacteria bacterium]